MNEALLPMTRRYFSRAIAGMEDIVWQDIKKQLKAELVTLEWRRIDFFFDGDPKQLLDLRSVDDIYMYVGKLYEIGKHRLSLKSITEQISNLSFSTAIDTCRRIRTIPSCPNYSVTATLLGKRNYSRFEVGKAIREGLASKYNWNYVEHSKKEILPDIDLRVLLEHGDGIVGVRLNHLPLHRRTYKIQTLPGSLKPPVAYIMCLLSGIQSHHVVLDPMCGVGTIPIEASHGFKAKRVFGLDINSESIAYSIANAEKDGCSVFFQIGNATQLPFEDNSIDRIITNMPWGKQVDSSIPLSDLYTLAIGEFTRVLSKGGRVVLLTDCTDLVLEAIKTHSELRQVTTKQISLFGSHPMIYVLIKSGENDYPIDPI